MTKSISKQVAEDASNAQMVSQLGSENAKAEKGKKLMKTPSIKAVSFLFRRRVKTDSLEIIRFMFRIVHQDGVVGSAGSSEEPPMTETVPIEVERMNNVLKKFSTEVK
jgi:hypothetical protein